MRQLFQTLDQLLRGAFTRPEDLRQGRVIINYSWGNQHGIEHLAEAVFEGTLQQFLKGWYPEA